MYQKRIETLAQLLKESRSTVFFGGAGVSTASGMKDYRSADGLYNTTREFGVSPETILSRSFFEKDPQTFYRFYCKYFLHPGVKPNGAHEALAKLEAKGMLSAVITPNVDDLHQKAGSKKVLELHGTTETYRCHSCRRVSPVEENQLDGRVLSCPSCGGVLRPQIVLYEEPLDNAVMDEAIDEIYGADLLIIGGTSLAVYPAAGFLNYFRGRNIVLINRDETPYDGRASLVFRESIAQVLPDAVKQVLA